MEPETACGEQSSSRVEFSFPYKSHHIEFSFSVFRISLKIAEQIGKKEMKTRTPPSFHFLGPFDLVRFDKMKTETKTRVSVFISSPSKERPNRGDKVSHFLRSHVRHLLDGAC